MPRSDRMSALAVDPDAGFLMCSTPSGERWSIPISAISSFASAAPFPFAPRSVLTTSSPARGDLVNQCLDSLVIGIIQETVLMGDNHGLLHFLKRHREVPHDDRSLLHLRLRAACD